MPDNCFEACEWLLPKITVALSDCKILPIRLQHLKHQVVLRDSNACYGAPCLCICLEVYTHVWVQALRHEDRPWQTMLLSWKPLTTRSNGSKQDPALHARCASNRYITFDVHFL